MVAKPTDSGRGAGRVVHLGQVIVDLTMRVPHLPQRGGDVFATEHSMCVGGGFNSIKAARQMRADVDYWGAIGRGPMASAVREALAQIGVRAAGPEVPDMDTGYCVAVTEPDGERSFLSTRGAETWLPDDAYQDLKIGPGDVVYLSGYSLCHADAVGALMAFFAAHQAAEAGAAGRAPVRAVFDVSPMVGDIPDEVLAAVAGIRPLWSVNEREAGILAGRLGLDGTGVGAGGAAGAESVESGTGAEGAAGEGRPDMSALALALAQALQAPVLVRAGAQGAWFVDGGSSDGAEPNVHFVPTPQVEAVDTNGAGDAHAGVLCAALAQGAAIERALLLANCAGALAVTEFGPATCPDRETIEAAARSLEADAGSLVSGTGV